MSSGSFGSSEWRCPGLSQARAFTSDEAFSADARISLDFPLHGVPRGRVVLSLNGSQSLRFSLPMPAGCRESIRLPALHGAVGPLPVLLEPQVKGAVVSRAAWNADLSENLALNAGVSFRGVHATPVVRLRSRPTVASLGVGGAGLGPTLRLGIGSTARAAVRLEVKPTASFTAGDVNCQLDVRAKLSAHISYGSFRLASAPRTTTAPTYKCPEGGLGPPARGIGPGGTPPPPLPPNPGFTGWGYASSGSSSAVLSTAAFATLKNHLGMKYARFVVPIDTVATARNGSCDPDYLHAQSAYNGLHDWLRATKAEGMVPLVSLVGGGATGDNAGNPLPNERNTTDEQYKCGLQNLIQTTDSWSQAGDSSPVTEWEVYNEPDRRGLCASVAAAFYADAVAVEQQLGRTDTLVAGGFGSGQDPYRGNHPDCGHPSGAWFIPDYVNELHAEGVWPSVFSTHPFDDVAASGADLDGNETPQTSDTLDYLNAQPGAHPELWLTEVGVWLRCRGLDAQGRPLGEDIDGSPLAQAWAAQGVLDLPDAAGQAYTGQVARVYYYELQTAGDGVSIQADHFDSALIGITDTDWSQSGKYDPAEGFYAVPRSSYCVLAYGDSPANAVLDTRCDFASTPRTPWSDWENPADLPVGASASRALTPRSHR